MAPKKGGGRTVSSKTPTPAAGYRVLPFNGPAGSSGRAQNAASHQTDPCTPDNSDTEGASTAVLPVVLSPVKRRQRKKDDSVKALSDIDAWSYSDDEIIDASFAGLKSPAYAHFDITLKRLTEDNGEPKELVFIFTCKTDPAGHSAHRRPRKKTSSGTGNLVAGMNACLKRQGLDLVVVSASASTIPYSPENHRTLIALRCAANMRPYNSVQDPLYAAEVEMLRPGTKIPDPTTVSRDVQLLYQEISKCVCQYFKNLGNAIHLAVDGWTAPITASFLGVVLIWSEQGEIHRIILEFIRLKKKHTGQYLAQCIADCLKRYGIAHL
ncbi:hypothetical protein EST38_g12250, partial [Candolleomyces aberdarensis]